MNMSKAEIKELVKELEAKGIKPYECFSFADYPFRWLAAFLLWNIGEWLGKLLWNIGEWLEHLGKNLSH